MVEDEFYREVNKNMGMYGLMRSMIDLSQREIALEWAKKNRPKLYKEYMDMYNEFKAHYLARKSEV